MTKRVHGDASLAARLSSQTKKRARQCNVFELSRKAGTTLTTMFPYLRAGDIVPAVSVFDGREDGNWGFFEHFNSVDEIIFSFGSTNGFIRPGEITCGARTHGVTAPLADHGDLDSNMIMVIIQRQDENIQAPQEEAIVFRCTECQHELLRHEYDGRENENEGRSLNDDFFLTPYICDAAAKRFNDDPDVRKCQNCGHENPPFPVDPWGWNRCYRQTNVAISAKQSIVQAADKQIRR